MEVSNEEPLDKSIVSELTEEIKGQWDKKRDKLLSQQEFVEQCNYVRRTNVDWYLDKTPQELEKNSGRKGVLSEGNNAFGNRK